jgi:cell shape-determining protein MreC
MEYTEEKEYFESFDGIIKLIEDLYKENLELKEELNKLKTKKPRVKKIKNNN